MYYVTMQITFLTRKFRNGERNLHCDVVHITTKWVSSLTLDCNGVFAIKAYSEKNARCGHTREKKKRATKPKMDDRGGAERGQRNKQGSMEDEDKQLYIYIYHLFA